MALDIDVMGFVKTLRDLEKEKVRFFCEGGGTERLRKSYFVWDGFEKRNCLGFIKVYIPENN